MDPISLAKSTAIVAVLATECAKGTVGQAGKDLWGWIKKQFGWKTEPKSEDLAGQIAQALNDNPTLAADIRRKIQDTPDTGSASILVGGSIQAEKINIIKEIHANRDVNIS